MNAENTVDFPIDISVTPYAIALGVVISWKRTHTGIIPSLTGRTAPLIITVTVYLGTGICVESNYTSI